MRSRVGFAPIVRIDAARREIELCATSEALDTYGTIFDYDASKAAFARWIGNVREMHERRAVGTRVGVRCDDAARKIYVRVRISRGAQDTWEKIQDGTLRGASIGASNVTWQRQTRAATDGERAVNVATAYDLVELSLVDNPANPDALGVSIVRDAVPDAALLDALDPADSVEPAEPAASPTPSSDNTLVPLILWRPDQMKAAEAPVTLTNLIETTSPTPEPAGSEAAQADQRLETEGRRAVPPSRSKEGFAANGHLGAGVQALNGGPHHWGLDSTAGSPTTRHPASFPERAGKDAGRSPLTADPLRVTHSWTDTRGTFSPAPSSPLPSVSSVSSVSSMNSAVDSPRSLGPFSTYAEGYPDVGAPARAAVRPTSDLGQTPAGNVPQRTHAAALAILALCACPLCQTAAALYDAPDAHPSRVAGGSPPLEGEGSGERFSMVQSPAIARALAAGLSANATHIQAVDTAVRGISASVQTLARQWSGSVGDLAQRLAALEAQPLPGGPVAHAAARPIEKSLALAPDMPRADASTAEKIHVLQSLAGRSTDPMVQVALAAEIIRLQQG